MSGVGRGGVPMRRRRAVAALRTDSRFGACMRTCMRRLKMSVALSAAMARTRAAWVSRIVAMAAAGTGWLIHWVTWWSVRFEQWAVVWRVMPGSK